MKKVKRQIKNIIGTSMIGAAGSVALGSIGGTVAAHGQLGISRAAGFMGPIGSMAGVGAVMESIKQVDFNKKRKKNRRR